jgi:transcriptional regulator with XRE-family HTH domain
MVNESLKLIRLYWGKTQQEMAAELGVSQSYISEVEKSKRDVTLGLLEKYSNILHVPMSQLLLFAENVEGAPPMGRGKVFVAGRVLDFLKVLVPDELEKAE